jgi:hypothetical protein
MKNKIDDTLTSPCRCSSIPSQYGSLGGGGRCRSPGIGGPAEETASVPLRNIKRWVSAQRRKSKQNTHLPLFAAAPYDRYQSGRGGVGSTPQFWEERSAEEQQTPSRRTSRGEFRMWYHAKNTNYLPSLGLLYSIQLISVGGRSGEAPEARGKRSEGGGCCGWASPSGGEEATLGGLPPKRGRGNNGHIMDGRSPGVDGRRKRRWRREGGRCGASDSLPWWWSESGGWWFLKDLYCERYCFKSGRCKKWIRLNKVILWFSQHKFK